MSQPDENVPTAEILARRKLFTAALRSGDYVQGKGHLHEIRHINGTQAHCCLGVACLVAIEHGLQLPSFRDRDQVYYSYTGNPDDDEYNNNVQLPEAVAKWYGWPARMTDPELVVRHGLGVTETSAVGANDELGATFDEIADAFDNKYVLPYEPVQGAE